MKRILIGYLTSLNTGIGKYNTTLASIVSSMGYEVHFMTPVNSHQIRAYARDHGYILHQIHNLKHPVKQYRDIKRLLEQNRYDAVYVNISEAFNSLGIQAAHAAGVPRIIVHSHNSGPSLTVPSLIPVKKCLHRIFKRLIVCRYADVFCACSEKAGEWMYTAKLIRKNKVRYIHNAVDLDAYWFDPDIRQKVRSELQAEDRFIVGFVGHMLPAKNAPYALEIIRALHNMTDKAVLVMAGSDFGGMITRLAEQNGMNDYVRILGSRTDVPELLQGFDAFIMPSFNEGLPYAAVEAQAAGLPVFMSDAVTEEIRLTDRCFFLPVDQDAALWAEAILEHRADDRTVDRQLFRLYSLDHAAEECTEILGEQ